MTSERPGGDHHERVELASVHQADSLFEVAGSSQMNLFETWRHEAQSAALRPVNRVFLIGGEGGVDTKTDTKEVKMSKCEPAP